MSEELPEYMTVKEAAEMLRVTDWTIRRYLREGKVFKGAVRPGRNWLIPRSEVHDMFKKEYNK